MKKYDGSSNIGLSTVLTLIFVVLKLIGAIDWSWWWVLSPTLITVGLWIVFIVVYVIYLIHEDKGKTDKWKF